MAAAQAAGPRRLYWTLGSSAWPRGRATLPGAASVTRGPAAGGCLRRGSIGAHAGEGQLWFPLLPMAPAGAGLLHPGPRATGPGILFELVFLPRGKRPNGQNPSLEPAAAPGSRQWQRKPLGALGWRRGARARARAEPGVRARAANRAPPPSRRQGCCEGRGGWDSGPTCRTQTRQRMWARNTKGIPAQKNKKYTPYSSQATGYLKGLGVKATLAALRP